MLATLPTAESLVLRARTAADVMTRNPMSLRAEATVAEAIDALIFRNYGAAPVINEAGRPVGVISQADLLVHAREHYMSQAFSSFDVDPSRVEDIMTTAVFCVHPQTPLSEVVQRMLSLRVHHLFVVDASGTLIGAISALDLLRRLECETKRTTHT